MRIFEDKIMADRHTDSGQLMLYREIMAVCSEIHTKHINTVCGAERRVVEC